MKVFVVFIGTAGSGKSTLTASYGRWLREEMGSSVSIVNLDPAAEYIPYIPDFDVRKYINAHEIAIKLGLGPNGALLKSMQMLVEELHQILEEIMHLEGDYILVDTPGQMDFFVFGEAGPKFFEKLLTHIDVRTVSLLVMDATVIRRAEDYAFMSIVAAALQGRLGVDVIPVVNKIDAVENFNFVGDVVSDVEDLVKELSSRNSGIYGELLRELVEVAWKYVKGIRVPHVSAKTLRNIEELHRIVHEFTCTCGDLT